MATFRKRINGRWQAILRRRDLRASRTFERLVDAKSWARAREREADLAGTMPAKMSGTLASVIDRYEREMWQIKRWGASKAHELDALRRGLGSRLLSDLTRSVVLTYARSLKIAPAGIAGRLSYLREVLRAARDLWTAQVPLDEIDAAIAIARRTKIAGRSLARTRRPSEGEVENIIAFAESQTRSMVDLGPILNVLRVVPLRIGELVNIQWEDLDEKRRSAIIRSRKHPDNRVKETNDQEVPLINFRGVDTFALVHDRPRYLPSPFPYKTSSVSAAFHFAALRCRIVNLHLHDLRAHALSSLLEAGMPIPLVAVMSGHRNWKVLAKHYARIDPTSVHESVKRLS